MADNTKNLENGWKKRSEDAKKKALKTIDELKEKGKAVNFNSVHIESGLSKNYLYANEEIRTLIIKERDNAKAISESYHEKYDKTSKSKDVVIKSKDKYIAKLEAEIIQLKNEVNRLRAMVYENK